MPIVILAILPVFFGFPKEWNAYLVAVILVVVVVYYVVVMLAVKFEIDEGKSDS